MNSAAEHQVRVLLAGANGQLGWELQQTAPAGIELLAFGSAELDITDPDMVRSLMADLGPDVVINAAAYTKVDKAEEEQDRAFLVNRFTNNV